LAGLDIYEPIERPWSLKTQKGGIYWFCFFLNVNLVMLNCIYKKKEYILLKRIIYLKILKAEVHGK